MAKLTEKKCVPCESGEPTLKPKEIEKYLKELGESWRILKNLKIEKSFGFKDFKGAISFVNKVAGLAEEEGHHPDILIEYNKVNITIWTHAIGGLSENDFILAAKIDNLD
jgi:4a-hydroxytetrahydrobiopterin dehydratase